MSLYERGRRLLETFKAILLRPRPTPKPKIVEDPNIRRIKEEKRALRKEQSYPETQETQLNTSFTTIDQLRGSLPSSATAGLFVGPKREDTRFNLYVVITIVMRGCI